MIAVVVLFNFVFLFGGEYYSTREQHFTTVPSFIAAVFSPSLCLYTFALQELKLVDCNTLSRGYRVTKYSRLADEPTTMIFFFLLLH